MIARVRLIAISIMGRLPKQTLTAIEEKAQIRWTALLEVHSCQPIGQPDLLSPGKTVDVKLAMYK